MAVSVSNLEVVSELAFASFSDSGAGGAFLCLVGFKSVSKFLLWKIVTSSYRWLKLVYSV